MSGFPLGSLAASLDDMVPASRPSIATSPTGGTLIAWIG